MIGSLIKQEADWMIYLTCVVSGHVETQTMQTADCPETADCADRADCAEWVLLYLLVA